MNDEKSLKLHKSHKIVCFIVCFVIVFATLTVSAFADEGVYNLNGLFNFRIPANDMQAEVYSQDGSITFSPFTASIEGFDDEPIDATIRIVGVNYLQISPNRVVLLNTYNDNASIGSFTIEATIDGETQTFTALGVSFEPSGNGASVYFGDQLSGFEFTGMPSTMRFNGMFTTGTIDTDYFIDYFGRIEEYDGNPWVDILNGVATALDVNIFGTFSYLDIVSTLAGACLCIWLLKMLAGG